MGADLETYTLERPESARAGLDRRLRAGRDEPAGGRARDRRAGDALRAARSTSASCSSARTSRRRFPSRARTSASSRRPSWPPSTGVRASARLLADEPLARRPGDDGVRPAGRRARRRERLRLARALRRARACSQGRLPSGVADAIERLLDNPDEAAAMADASATSSSRGAHGHTPPSRWRPRCSAFSRLRQPAADHPRRRPAAGTPSQGPSSRSVARPNAAGSPSCSRSASETTCRRLERRIAVGPDERRRARAGLTRAATTTIGDIWRQAADDLERKRLTLALGVHYGIDALLERTGLTAEMPPPDDPPARSRPYRRRRVDLPRRPRRRRAGQRRCRARLPACESSISVARRAESSRACCRLSGGRMARMRPERRPPSSGLSREHAEESTFAASPVRPPLSYADASFDARLRDLDLVPLRRGRCAALARRDAPHHPPGRPTRADDARLTHGCLLRPTRRLSGASG